MLEIGAYDRTISTGLKAAKYAEYFDYDEFIRQAKNQQDRDPNAVNDVRYVLNQIELTDIDERIDYVVASLVFKHVPNPIHWLNNIMNLLNPGGLPRRALSLLVIMVVR